MTYHEGVHRGRHGVSWGPQTTGPQKRTQQCDTIPTSPPPSKTVEKLLTYNEEVPQGSLGVPKPPDPQKRTQGAGTIPTSPLPSKTAEKLITYHEGVPGGPHGSTRVPW